MFVYSEREEEEIEELMEKIYDDLIGICEKANIDMLEVKIKYDFEEGRHNPDPILTIDDGYITICTAESNEDDEYEYEYELDECGISRVGLDKDDEYRDDLEFINNYPLNRQRIMQRVEELTKKKNQALKTAKKIRKFLEHGGTLEVDGANMLEDQERRGDVASIQIELPQNSINRHEIEISHEDGKTIGTINLSGKTIRIITNGNLAVVNNNAAKEEEKVKVIK